MIVSPASLKSLLAMLVEGSTGDTEDEILRALNLRCFYISARNYQQVKFMNQKRALSYLDSNKHKAEIFEISFKDPRYRIVFLLPHTNTDVHIVLATLNGKDLLESIIELEGTSIHLYMPRTVVDFSTSMVGTMNKLGIISVFGPYAKLNNMVKNTKLWVGDMIHKARIEMNEEGAKVTGVSGGTVQFLGADIDRRVIVDRPFLFFIRDITIGRFLFEGIVFSPDQAH